MEIDSEDENTSPYHKSIENDKTVENSYEENDPMVNEGSDKHYHDISECKTASARNYSPNRSNKSLQRVLKHDFGSRISRLEIEVEKLRANVLVKDEEMKTLKGELVSWVSRWQDLKQEKTNTSQ